MLVCKSNGKLQFRSQGHILCFWESGGPSADEVDLEVDLKSTSGRPQVNFGYLPTHLRHLPKVHLKSTSGRLGSQPRRHTSQCSLITYGMWPNAQEQNYIIINLIIVRSCLGFGKDDIYIKGALFRRAVSIWAASHLDDTSKPRLHLSYYTFVI